MLGLWPTFGTVAITKNIQVDYWKCELVQSYDVTHNVKFLLFKYEQNIYNHVYPGRHVYVKANVNGMYLLYFQKTYICNNLYLEYKYFFFF